MSSSAIVHSVNSWDRLPPFHDSDACRQPIGCKEGKILFIFINQWFKYHLGAIYGDLVSLWQIFQSYIGAGRSTNPLKARC